MAFLFLATVLLAASAIDAAQWMPEFYHEVDGDCEDLFKIRDDTGLATGRQVSPGVYYIPHASFGGKCGGAYALIRPKQNLGFGDIHVIPEGESEYRFFPNDVIFHKENRYSMEALNGGTSQVLTVSKDSHIYFVQCISKDDKNPKAKMGIMYGLRKPEWNPEAKKAYDDFSKKLKDAKLWPKMFELDMKGCPAILGLPFFTE